MAQVISGALTASQPKTMLNGSVFIKQIQADKEKKPQAQTRLRTLGGFQAAILQQHTLTGWAKTNATSQSLLIQLLLYLKRSAPRLEPQLLTSFLFG